MKKYKKLYGQDLKRKLDYYQLAVSNLEKKIDKRLKILYEKRPDLFDENQEKLYRYVDVYLNNDRKNGVRLELIISIEDKYAKESSQADMFD